MGFSYYVIRAGIAVVLSATLISFVQLPDFGFWNSTAAVAGMQLVALGVWLAYRSSNNPATPGAKSLYLALLLYGVGGVWSFSRGVTPYPGVALQLVGAMMMTALAFWSGLRVAQHGNSSLLVDRQRSADVGRMTVWLVVWVGVVQALIGLVQLLGVDWPGLAIAIEPGRSYGNIRQSNQYAFVLFCGMIAAVTLLRQGMLRPIPFVLCFGLHVAAMISSGSRTGLALVGLVFLWLCWEQFREGDRTKTLLLAGLATMLVAGLVTSALLAVGIRLRIVDRMLGTLATGEFDGLRFQVWMSAIRLLADAPWAGVGVGGLRFALAFGPYDIPAQSNFDNLHNMPLQLLVELGLPIGLAVLGCVAYSLWRCRTAWTSFPGRALIIWLVGLFAYSLVEFPLWSTYFLLPAAFGVGTCLAISNRSVRETTHLPSNDTALSTRRQASSVVLVGLIVTALMHILLVRDYMRISPIYDKTKAAIPLQRRMDEAQQSFWFVHHAHYSLLAQPDLRIDDPVKLERLCRLVSTQVADDMFMFRYTVILIAAGQSEKAVFLTSRLVQRRSENVNALAAFAKGSSLPAARAVANYLETPVAVRVPMAEFR